MSLKLQIGKDARKVALAGFFVVLAIVMLAKFGAFDITDRIADVLVIFASILLFMEIARERSKKKFGAFDYIGMVIAGVVFVTGVFGIVGVPMLFFNPVEGFALAFLLLFLVIEFFQE